MLFEKSRLNGERDLRALVRPDEGAISRRIFGDPEIYQLELERIFTRSWLFVAHASEIPNPGDYVLRYTGRDQVIVTRTEGDEFRVFLNSCRHRGNQVCRAEKGNTSHFRCPYHGWTYKNNGALIGVPAYKEAYGGMLDRRPLGLLEPPHVASVHGFIFVNWDPGAPSLDEYLGDMRWYLDLLFDRTDGGVEVVGAPQRSEAPMDWKLPAENICGDGYHVAMTHRHAFELGIFKGGTVLGHTIHTANGHTVRIQNFPPDVPAPRYLGLPDDIVEAMERRLSPEQLSAIERITVIHGNVFPNLGFVEAIFTTTGDPTLPPVSCQSIHQYQPTGATSTESWFWLLVPREASEEWREAARVTYIRTHSLAGTFFQDDHENFTNITAINRGLISQRDFFNHTLGLFREPDKNWPGPGVAYAADYNEANHRAFYRQWLRTMTADIPGEVDA